MLGHTSVSRWRGREFSAASCSFRHTTVVLDSEQNPLLFWPLAYDTSAKAKLVRFFFLEKQEKNFCKVTFSEWVYELNKAKRIFKAAEISSLAE